MTYFGYRWAMVLPDSQYCTVCNADFFFFCKPFFFYFGKKVPLWAFVFYLNMKQLYSL